MPDPRDMDDEAIARLDALAAQVPPRPSDALAGRLRADRLTRSAPARARRVMRLPVLLPSIAVAALVLGFVLVATGGNETPSVVLQTATNASVETDGHTVAVTAGTKLPEGAVVVTGPSGSVTAGGLTLGPGERAIVRRGRLERLLRREARREQASTTTTAAGSSTSAAPPPPALPPVALRLVARRGRNGEVGLEWTQYQGTDFGSYVVLRGRERSVVTRHTDPARLRAVDLAAPAARTPYVVVVLDRAGRAVARSEVVDV